MIFSVFRDNIQENVDMIKLQREIKEKASKLQVVEAKYLSLNEVHTLQIIKCGYYTVDVF